MELKFVWMGNYKSIGDVTKLVIDPKVTCLIGKNESGKSNILDFISKNTLLKSISRDVYLQKHREFSEESTSTLTFEFKLSDEEQTLLGVNSKSERIEFNYDRPNPAISGAISEYFLKDTYSNLYEEFEALGDAYLYKEDIKKQFINYCSFLKNAHQRISFNHFEIFNWLEKIGVKPYFNEEEGVDKYLNSFLKFKEYYLRPYNLLPEIFYYQESFLKNSYNLDVDFFDKGTGSDTAIENFIIATKCSKHIFRKATTSTNAGEKQDAKEEIQEAVREEIEKPFNNFYKQENVKISISVEGTILKVFIKTTGRHMQISERSNGLRWYLNLFVALKANDTKSSNVIFLMDEPGVHLHVDAQKNYYHYLLICRKKKIK